MERKTIWKILHLDTPTTDIEKIKQAYSQQSKTCNPEDNPEEFQELYNAYKQAIKYAKNFRDSKSNNKVVTIEYVNRQVQDLKRQNNNSIDDKKANLEERNVSKENGNENLNVSEVKNQITNIAEELNSFRELDLKNDESTRIQKMIIELDQSLKKGNKQLKEIMSSEEFFQLLNVKNFQLALSKYLNTKLKLDSTKIYIIKKSLKKYIKKYGKKNLTNSLSNYFNIIRKKKAPYYYPALILFGFVIFIMLALAGKNNRKYNYNNEYNLNGIKITTNDNEILTYDQKTK